MNKICNFRPLFFISVSILIGLLTAYYTLVGKFFVVYITLALYLVALIGMFSIFKKLNIKHYITYGICAIFTICAFFGIQLKANSFNVSDLHNVNVTGYISKINSGNGYQILTITKAKVQDKSLTKNITVYLSGVSEFQEGEIIRFNADLEKQSLVTDNQLNQYILFNNTAYSANVYSENIEIVKYSPTLSLTIKNYVRNILSKNYSAKNTALVYAMLFGDKTLLSDFDVTSYNEIGLAHIFAVSGLHISIIFMIISFVLSKFKLKRKVNFLITLLLSVGYCSLCGFSPSVVRATVMSLCLLFASIVKKQGDSFNAFCLAFILLTFINPFNFLNAGFQLSFMCVFSILSLSPVLIKVLKKKIPINIASSFAVSFSAFIGTLIILVKIYGFFNPLSIIFNMILIPLFTVIFIIIFVLNIISCLIPVLSCLNQAPNLFLTLYNSIVDFLAKIPSNIAINQLGIVCLLSFLVFIFVAGNFCLIKKFYKVIVSACLVIISLTSGVFCAMPTNFNYNSITAIRSTYENCYLLTDSSNSRILIVNTLNHASSKTINEYLNKNKISYLTYIIARKITASQSQLEFLQTITKAEILTLEVSSFGTFEEYEVKTLGNYTFMVLNHVLKEDGIVATINNKNILFCFAKLNGAGNNEYLNQFTNFHIICSLNYNYVTIEADNHIVFKTDQITNSVINTKDKNIYTIKL